jgi:hypothetical protein
MLYLKIFYYFIIFIIVANLFPKEIKEPIPKLWGAIEGSTGIDHTGFAFTPLNGNGNCRIVNTRLALASPGSKIVFGMVKPLNGRAYPHLWVTNKANILDLSCPITNRNCQNRTPFAIINPVTLALEMSKPQNEQEIHQVIWGLKYLSGFKSVSNY